MSGNIELIITASGKVNVEMCWDMHIALIGQIRAKYLRAWQYHWNLKRMGSQYVVALLFTYTLCS